MMPRTQPERSGVTLLLSVILGLLFRPFHARDRQAGRASFVSMLLGGCILLTGCYTVNSAVDAVDANPGDGTCARALTPIEISSGTVVENRLLYLNLLPAELSIRAMASDLLAAKPWR